jgi:hypothetical protein
MALDWKPPVRAQSRDAKRASTRFSANRKHGAGPPFPLGDSTCGEFSRFLSLR